MDEELPHPLAAEHEHQLNLMYCSLHCSLMAH
jgi:hypothetical protein